MNITLRPIEDSDLPVFFEHQQHKPAQHMAAFVHEDPSDRGGFDAHWSKLMGSDSILKRSIEMDGTLVRHIMSFDMMGDREITYWIDHHHWGKGIATAALRLFIDIESTRPLNGRAAKDNIASIRSMEKCGFVLAAEERGFANGRGEEIDEVVMVLQKSDETAAWKEAIPKLILFFVLMILTTPVWFLYRLVEVFNSLFVLGAGLVCVWSVYLLISSSGASVAGWILLPVSLLLVRLYFLIQFDSDRVYESHLFKVANKVEQRIQNRKNQRKQKSG